MTYAEAALPQRAAASEPLRRFLQVVRGAGLRVSAAEGIDAARAVDLVGYDNRTLLKDTLGMVLAKTPDEKAIYDETFDRYFQRKDFAGAKDGEQKPPARPRGMDPAAQSEMQQMGGAGAPAQSLSDMLENDDDAGLAASMEMAASEAGLEKIRLATQKNVYARNILQRMGMNEVQKQIESLRASDELQDQERAKQLEQKLDKLWAAARQLVEQALGLYARGETEQLRERLLRSAQLERLDPSQLERMRVLVRQIAKRLATRYATKRKRFQRGQLDVRRTLRRNMSWGGVPFITVWKQKRIEKARVMVLVDVSESVAWVAQFLLMFLYSLTEVLTDIRSFAYTSTVMEVSDVMEKQPIDDAIGFVMAEMGFGTSNYGTVFEAFEEGWMKHVTNKTIVLILGDARGNGTDPRLDIVGRIAERAKKIVWLNPEMRAIWGTGDSDIYRYAPFCSLVRVCSTLNDLERVITDLLDDAA